MYIETRRLIIRDYSPSDWRDLYEIFSDPVVMRECEPAYTEEKTRDMLAYFIEKSIAYAVVLEHTGKVIGHALFSQLPPPDTEGTYEIGWIYHRDYWQQGYAYEAAKALIDYGFQEMGLHKICAETIDPLKSVGLMKKLGMSHEATFHSQARDSEGKWTDLYWYSICNPMEEPKL